MKPLTNYHATPVKDIIGAGVSATHPDSGAATGLQAAQVRYLEVDEESAGQRLDNYLLRHLKGVPKSRIYRIVPDGMARPKVRDLRGASGDELLALLASPNRELREQARAALVEGGHDVCLLDVHLGKESGLVALRAARDEATAAVAAEVGADFVGVVLVESSPRFVEPAAAKRLARAHPGGGGAGGRS